MASIREDLEADDALRQCTALLQVRSSLLIPGCCAMHCRSTDVF